MARPKKNRVVNEDQNYRYETYQPPSSYELPGEVVDMFKAQGLALRYVRVILDNKEDYKNIADRRREGWEFVALSELPPQYHSMYETKSIGNAATKFSDIVMVGDLALMKIPEGKVRARKRYYEQLAIDTELAQTANLSRDSKLNRLLPIYDESETVVRTGGRNTSPGEFGKTLSEEKESPFHDE